MTKWTFFLDGKEIGMSYSTSGARLLRMEFINTYGSRITEKVDGSLPVKGMKVNTNQLVRVTPTPMGWDCMQIKDKWLEKNEDGSVDLHLWKLMFCIGPFLFVGNFLLIEENEIIFLENE